MGAKKSPRPSASLKNLSKRSSLRNRPYTGPQINKSQIINKQQTETSFLPRQDRKPKIKPLSKLFDRRGMTYGRRTILRTVRNDYQLRRELLNHGILTREGVEESLLELLFQYRNLKDWDSGGDNLVDVFRLIKGRVK